MPFWWGFWTDVLWQDFAELLDYKGQRGESRMSRPKWFPISELDENVGLAIVAQRCPWRTLREFISTDSFMKRGGTKVTCYIMI
jgi:hypothetical protein